MCLSVCLSACPSLCVCEFFLATTTSFVELYSCVWLLVPLPSFSLFAHFLCFVPRPFCLCSSRLTRCSHISPAAVVVVFFFSLSLASFLSFPSKLFYILPSWVPRSKLLKGKAQDSACDHFQFLPCPLSSSIQPNQTTNPQQTKQRIGWCHNASRRHTQNIE